MTLLVIACANKGNDFRRDIKIFAFALTEPPNLGDPEALSWTLTDMFKAWIP